jgi:hypothetical protein
MAASPAPSLRYEVYLAGSPSWNEENLIAAIWNWCLLDADERIIERGTGYASMVMCFAAISLRQAAHGEAPVSINLMHVATPPPVRQPATPDDDHQKAA